MVIDINKKIMSKLLFLVAIFFALIQIHPVQKDEEIVIVRVGNRTITKTEFINRAEYVPRPDYCRLDNYIHRKIVLNTLIAEKLLAIEAGENNELTTSPEYAAYITGRKEQAMRQIHYYEIAYTTSKPDSATVAKVYNAAGRTYNVSYFRLKDSTLSHQVYNDIINSGISFDSLCIAVSSSDTIPTKKISYLNQELPVVHNSLFSDELVKGEILEPINVDNSYLFIRVDGWTDRVAVSEEDKNIRWNDVYNKLTGDNAAARYEDYVAEIMRGKRIVFNRPTFEKLVEIIAPYYLQSNKSKKNLLNNSLWTPSSEDEVLMDNLYDVNDIKNWELLKIDGEIWTVEKLTEELMKHPLVFRKRELKRNNFAEQMKLAIVDLVRDKYITRDAYENGFDDHPLVLRNTSLWQDNLLALYQKFIILESVGDRSMERMKLLDEVMNPYVRSLQKKHSNVIKINIKEFEDIKLSSLDMIAIQPDQAFPIIVPLFPELTTMSKLDYGEVTN
jgi:hypothetical protein